MEKQTAPLAHIRTYEQLKVLADPRRLMLLQRLMDTPATISQLGRVFDQHPAWVRHHIKRLESVGLVQLIRAQEINGVTEKYYAASASAFSIQMFLLPHELQNGVLLTGSHDLAVELLAQRQNQNAETPPVLLLPNGSLDGLIALRQGMGQMSGAHLLDAETGEYNITYARHLFTDQEVRLLTVATRVQGLMVAPGNPLGIRGMEDLARTDVTLANRNRGSGTRLWLDMTLRRLNLPAEGIRGYQETYTTHTAVAEAVQQGKASVGLGLMAAARAHGLDFIPLFEERYDLTLPLGNRSLPALQPLLNDLQSAEFRRKVESLGGYDTHHTGDEIIP